MKIKLFSLSFFILLHTPLLAKRKGDDLRLFNKCYAQFLNKRAPRHHPFIKEIEDQRITGVKACESLFWGLSFNELGMIEADERLSVKEKRGLLRTIQKFHDTWFKRFNLNVNTQDYTNSDVYDTNEMGYHLTWVLIQEEPLKNIVTQKRSFRAMRWAEEKPQYLIDRDISGYRHKRVSSHKKWKMGGEKERDSDEFMGPITFYSPLFVQTGELVGLRPFHSSDFQMKKLSPKHKSLSEGKSFDALAPKGGGIIGSVPYLLLNSGHIDKKMDGGLFLHRRWSTALIKDLMCRDLPLFKKEEVKVYTQPHSKIPFQRSRGCMSCHATIDPMASVIGNMENYNSGNVSLDHSLRNIYFHHPEEGAKGSLGVDYYKSKPKGRYFYKDIFKTIHNEEIHSLDDLGEQIAKTKDLYHCVASRYFNFLTGIPIDINEKDYISKEGDTPEYFVRKLAKDLEDHQSLKKLMSSIFSSDFYGI